MNQNHVIKRVPGAAKQFLNKCVILALVLCSFGQAMAQSSGKISGTVLSKATGEPLIGVSVTIVGTGKGSVTDINGLFAVPAKVGETLKFSYIGYETTEIKITGEKLTVRLTEDSRSLEEVVVVGYGVQKKKLNTGATLQVKGDEVAKMNTTSPLQALQGKTPGVNIASTSGQPGADMKVTIRGLGTVGNSGPLYIIDGIEGDITSLNASDIQSIDVLKDAASAAIYGAQAANGVVLVTTKQGTKGHGQVSFDAYTGVQNVARTTPMLNSTQYMTIMDEQSLNSKGGVYDWSSKGSLANTDWVKQMFKSNAKTENYALNINGGSEASVYSISLNYTNQEGIVGGKDVSNYERYGFRVNTEHNLYKNALKVGQHLNFNYINNRGVNVGNQYNNTLRSAFGTSPLSPVYSANNKYDNPYNDTSNSLWYNSDGNPYGAMMVNTNNRNSTQKLMADIYAELELIKNLKIKSTLGINYYSSNYRSYTPLYRFSIYSYNEDHTTTTQSMATGQTLTWTNTASYDFKINADHAFNALVGMEAVKYSGVGVGGSNWNLLSQFNDFDHAYLSNTTGKAHLSDDGESIVHTLSVNGAPAVEYRRASYFGRVGYNYKEKYMFNATLRADGSSKFANGNQFGYFPSVSAGWNMNTESFMEATSTWLDQLKLRASWGQVGNNNIPDFQYTAPINTSTLITSDDFAAFYNFGTSGTNVAGAYQSRLANTRIKWETSEQTNIGFDARLLKNRLGVNADFYIKNTKDWLVTAPIPATSGAKAPVINGGDVNNTGFELALNWNDHIGDLHYNVGVNGAYNRNRVGKIPTLDGIIHGKDNMLYDNSEEFYRAENGHAIGYFWGYKTAGIFQNAEDIAAWKAAGKGILQQDVQPGDVKYVDTNKDGVLNSLDKTDLGSGNPDVSYGLNISLDYKNFDFAVNATGSVGNKIVQSYRNQTNIYSNYTTEILSRWTGEGTSNRIPRVTNTNINWQFSDLYVHDGDFLRISNITLGYDFGKLMKLKNLSQLRIYGSVQNAFTFTKYNGMDPEIGYGVENWVSGVDLGYYPRPRTFLVGVNLKF